jgi:hypothetical protein
VPQVFRYTANRWTDPLLDQSTGRSTNRRSAMIRSYSVYGQDKLFKVLVNWSPLFTLPLLITTLPGKPITLYRAKKQKYKGNTSKIKKQNYPCNGPRTPIGL